MSKRFLSILVSIVALIVAFLPSVAVASHPCSDTELRVGETHDCDSGAGSITTFVGLLNRVNAVLNTIIPFLVGIAVFIVIWGVFKYIASAAEEEKRVEARAFIVWGVVGIFAMVSVWGFVNIMVNSFDISTRAPDARPNLPPIPGS